MTQAWYLPSPSTVTAPGNTAVRSVKVECGMTGALPTTWNRPGGLSLGCSVAAGADGWPAVGPAVEGAFDAAGAWQAATTTIDAATSARRANDEAFEGKE